MPMLQGFADRFRGTVALALQQQVADDIDRLICQLLEAATALWHENNWFSYDRDEENCTVQLYRWCKAVRRRDRRYTSLEPHLEWINVTDAILAGSESVKSANRPDLRIEVGEVGRAIECKRLEPSGNWPRAYVYKGMARFVTGNYGHKETVGYMVGYVQIGPPAVVVANINTQVGGHPGMGAGHQLKPLRDNESLSWHRSHHSRPSARPIRIDHLFIDMS